MPKCMIDSSFAPSRLAPLREPFFALIFSAASLHSSGKIIASAKVVANSGSHERSTCSIRRAISSAEARTPRETAASRAG